MSTVSQSLASLSSHFNNEISQDALRECNMADTGIPRGFPPDDVLAKPSR